MVDVFHIILERLFPIKTFGMFNTDGFLPDNVVGGDGWQGRLLGRENASFQFGQVIPI